MDGLGPGYMTTCALWSVRDLPIRIVSVLECMNRASTHRDTDQEQKYFGPLFRPNVPVLARLTRVLRRVQKLDEKVGDHDQIHASVTRGSRSLA